jgi:hypothetical protein
MAATSRSDIKRWLLNAEDAVGTDKTAQIQWLKEQRRPFAQEAGLLDWEVTATSAESSSTQMKRGTTNRAEHDAIVGAIEKLQAALGTGGASRGTLLGFKINHISG